MVIDVTDMEGLPANAGINIVTNYINGLKNVISSRKSGEMAFFLEKQKQIIKQNLVKGEDAVTVDDKTVWVTIQGLVQTLLVRLPLAYYMIFSRTQALQR